MDEAGTHSKRIYGKVVALNTVPGIHRALPLIRASQRRVLPKMNKIAEAGEWNLIDH